MKFPITRESLQSFDPVQEKKEKDNIVIKNHINSIVHTICGEIETRMLGPQPLAHGIPMNFNDNIPIEKRAHEKIMKDKRFIWEGIRNMRPGYAFGLQSVDVDESVLIPLLVEKLKETFVGCDIIIDPLKTYIIIDWS